MKISQTGAVALALASLASLSSLAPIPDTFVLEGVVHPWRVVHVGAAADGILGSVSVERGDRVTEGEVLGELAFEVEEASAILAEARRDARSGLDSARAQLADARRQLERRELLWKDKLINAEELDKNRTAVRLQELAVQAAEEKQHIAELEAERARAIVARGTIKSPLEGYVTERFLSRGELLSKSGQPNLVTIAQLDPLRIDVHAPLELYAKLKVGDECSVELLSFPGEERNARVSGIDRLVDTASDTFRVRLEMPNPGGDIPAGLRCRVLPRP